MNLGHDLRESLRRAAATAPSEGGAWDRFERRLRRRRATRTWTAGASLAVAVVLALVVAGPNLLGPSGSGSAGGGMGLAPAPPDTFVAVSSSPLRHGLDRYDARTGRRVPANPAGEGGLNTYALGPDGSLLLAQSLAGRCETTLDQLDWHGGRTSRGSIAMGEVLTTIAISPNGHQVAVAGRTCAGRPAVAVAALGEDRLVPRVLVEVPRPASSLSFSSDGRLLGFVTGDRGARYTAHVLATTSPPGRYDQLPAFQPVTPGCGYRAVAFGLDTARLLAATTCPSKPQSVLVELDVRSGRAATVRTAPGQVATLDFDASRGHVLMQMVRPADPLVPVALFRWDRQSAPKRIPVAAGITNAQW
jgi:hypothetical protein